MCRWARQKITVWSCLTGQAGTKTALLLRCGLVVSRSCASLSTLVVSRSSTDSAGSSPPSPPHVRTSISRRCHRNLTTSFLSTANPVVFIFFCYTCLYSLLTLRRLNQFFRNNNINKNNDDVDDDDDDVWGDAWNDVVVVSLSKPRYSMPVCDKFLISPRQWRHQRHQDALEQRRRTDRRVELWRPLVSESNTHLTTIKNTRN